MPRKVAGTTAGEAGTTGAMGTWGVAVLGIAGASWAGRRRAAVRVSARSSAARKASASA